MISFARFVLGFASAALIAGSVYSAAPAASKTPTQLPRTVRPTHYDVALEPDAGALTFKGNVSIAIEVLQPTATITVNAIGMRFNAVRLQQSQGAAVAPKSIAIGEAEQTATFTFDKQIAPGAYRLDLDYVGKIGTLAVGLFAMDYPTATGQKRALYTQFEPSDARRMIPSWDEPEYKATFSLSATVPKEQVAISNMPVAQRTDLPNGRSRVQFQRSPKMSTYLLFFGVGDFDRATAKLGPTELGVVTQKGKASQAAFALDSSVQVLREYNDYFGIHDPLPKLDNIASPGRSQFFGAMENWGAIYTFEYALLLDPSISTQSDKQSVFGVAAHEMAHQWFGDLVTMSWWDDLWLNEGFASWMATRTTQRLHPEWNTILSTVRIRENAMDRDALATTHPIVQRVETVEQANQAFDAISYSKGESVIRMLESYVGDNAWRAGVRQYMKTHAYGNTVSDDLWHAVETAANQPITVIAHDFTLQPGVPMIKVESAVCKDGKTTLQLTQGEFSKDQPNKKPLSWRVPVTIKPLRGGEAVRQLVTGGHASMSVQGCEPMIVNAGQSGYYRTLYSPAHFTALANNFASLPAIDQLGILSDSWPLGLAGLQPVTDVLSLARATPANADPQVWSKLAGVFARLDSYYNGLAGQGRLRTFAISRLAPVLKQIGWEPRAKEPDTIPILRNNLIETLGTLGDKEVIAEARRRYLAQDEKAMPAPLRKTILAVVGEHADAATWDRLHKAALAEKTPMVKDHLYQVLAVADDEALARRALELALTDEPGSTNAASMISQVSVQHPDLAFDFSLAHFDAVSRRVETSSQSLFFPALGGRSADAAMIDKLDRYARERLAPTSRRGAQTAIANVKDRIAIRRDRVPVIDAWLAHDSLPGRGR